jgi:hypothetical protein
MPIKQLFVLGHSEKEMYQTNIYLFGIYYLSSSQFMKRIAKYVRKVYKSSQYILNQLRLNYHARLCQNLRGNEFITLTEYKETKSWN